IATGESLSWVLSGAGDFDGDGQSDLLWRHATTGDVSVWLMDGTSLRRWATWPAQTTWELRGMGDFNNDNISDLLWVQPSTQSVSLWLMNGE
ncbi:FG-GAP repeat domain-containing protein, partial [Salmonella sp. SAL4358]|uniref:FG-GAP repeat domain-containing protein n=1 Tax=Salmonella sp. SAL4358 TaxID=3159879 RepID=UPI00397C6B17